MKIINKYRQILLMLIIFFIIFGLILMRVEFLNNYTNVTKKDLEKINKLMIVAHPDDEMIWGGAHLLKDDYLVVCITCGKNHIRVSEFRKVLKHTDDKYIMLNYADKKKGLRSNWEDVLKELNEDIDRIINLKDWEEIVTHNPFGEYGHIHHKITSRIVTKYAQDKNLYYFGLYYSKKNYKKLTNPLPRIDDETLNKKIEILKNYKTQSFIMHSFDQMFPHENFIKYEDWNY